MKLPKELLYKWSKGRCTSDEKKAIEEWMNDGEWDLNKGEILPDINDSIWQKLNRNITFPSQVVPITRRYKFLGTSFKVSFFPEVNHIIALSYGKVLVQNHWSNAVTDSFYLAPGEAIEYNKINKKIEKPKIEVPCLKVKVMSRTCLYWH